MKQIYKLIVVCTMIFGVETFSLDCPKDLTINFTSPKPNESVNGAKQKVTLATNVTGEFFYHLIQSNPIPVIKRKSIIYRARVKLKVIHFRIMFGLEMKQKEKIVVL